MDPKDIFKMKRRAQDKKSGSKNKKDEVVVKKDREEIYFKKGGPHVLRGNRLVPVRDIADLCL